MNEDTSSTLTACHNCAELSELNLHILRLVEITLPPGLLDYLTC